MPKLHVHGGPDAGKSFDVEDGATLGRDAACTVVLRDASISRRHARIERAGGAWRVVDTQSRNGLAVGGQRVESAELQDGAEFQLGEVRLRFTLSADAVRPPAAAEPEEIVLEGDWSAPSPAPNVDVRASFTSELERTTERPLPRQAELAPPKPVAPTGGARAAPKPTASAAPSPAAARPAASADASNESASTAPRAPNVPSNSAPAARTVASSARGVQMRAPERGQGGAAATRAVLQFNKVEARGGFSHTDLAQQPAWVKLLIALGALLLFAALAWAAFHTASLFKQKAGGDAVELEDVPDDAQR
ncbi:MAG: FHA domain-containing protein [Planctomycetes bacterium]|nr:FHA domain-containing protein [Planctomycetota bacterium]